MEVVEGLKRSGSVGKAASYRDMGLEVVVSSSELPIAATIQREKER